MTGWVKRAIGELMASDDKPPRTSLQSDIQIWNLNLDQIESESGRVLSRQMVPREKLGPSTYPFEAGTVLYSKLRPYLNKVVVADMAGFATTELVPLRCDKQALLPEYLAYVLRSKDFVDFASTVVAGAKMPRMVMSQFWAYEIPLPPLPEQRRIAAILDQAAALRAKRREALAHLDTLTQSIFIEMFGDPVRNPKNWAQENLGDFFHFRTGKLDSNAAVADGEYPFFTCAKEDFRIDKFAFDCEALLLAGNNANADYSVKHYKGKFNAYQRTYVITLKNAGNSYKYAAFVLENQLAELKRMSKGSSTKYLTMELLNRIRIPVPPQSLQSHFASRIAATHRIRLASTASLAELETLFASLQHRAFGGEL